MRRFRIWFIPIFLLVLLTACSGSLADEERGFLPMAPYVNEQMGLRSIAPAEWTLDDAGVFARQKYSGDNTAYIVLGFPGLTAEDVVPLILEQSGLEGMPPPSGTARSLSVEWDLYELELAVPGFGETHGKLALGQNETGAYVVVVQAWQEDFEADRALLEMLFRYGLYNTRQLENP